MVYLYLLSVVVSIFLVVVIEVHQGNDITLSSLLSMTIVGLIPVINLIAVVIAFLFYNGNDIVLIKGKKDSK
jgi:hypothetical protein